MLDPMQDWPLMLPTIDGMAGELLDVVGSDVKERKRRGLVLHYSMLAPREVWVFVLLQSTTRRFLSYRGVFGRKEALIGSATHFLNVVRACNNAAIDITGDDLLSLAVAGIDTSKHVS
jgi:hypothetical protein